MENILGRFSMEIKTEVKTNWVVSNTDKAYFFILMGMFIMDHGDKIFLMVKVFTCSLQDKFMMGCLENLKNMAEVLIITKMPQPFTQVCGKMIWNMVLELLIPHNCTTKVNGKKGLNMEVDMKKINSVIMYTLDNTNKVSNKEKEESFIKMVVCMQDSFWIKFRMELVIFSTRTKISILDNLLRAKSTERATIFSAKVQFLVDFGKMIKNFKDNWLFLMVMSLMVVLETIKDIKVNIGTEMVTFTRELGKMMLKMVLENFICKMDKNIKVSL